MKTLERIPEGYSIGRYLGKRYGISKTVFNQGKSVKLYAEALGDTDFVSLNYYSTQKAGLLKPCEMPKEKVLHFLKNVEL